jgi:hypothetical protein
MSRNVGGLARDGDAGDESNENPNCAPSDMI